MSILRSLALVLAGAAFVVLTGRQTGAVGQQQRVPVFRTAVELVQLDVTVRDRDGNPIRGLNQDDFTLLEDSLPQKIQAFTAIDIPDEVIERPVWDTKASPDVATNEVDNQRLFVLVLDDGRGMGLMEMSPARITDPKAIQNMKDTAAMFIERLRPDDMVAVVYTGFTHLSQNLTRSRAALLEAVHRYPALDRTLAFDGSGVPGSKCLAEKQSVRMINGIVDNLSSLPDRRKAIVYLGGSMPWASRPPSGNPDTANDDVCGTYWMWRDVFDAAEQAHVTINPIDVMGLRLGVNTTEYYLSVAEYTGGHAVIRTNDFEPGVRRIFLENSSYYLLAYQPTNGAADGRFRRITVRVSRPGAEVTTRRSYWAPREPRPKDVPKEPPPPEVQALSGLLPLTDLKLRLTAAPFAVPGKDGGVLAITVGVRQPPLVARTSESVELLIRAFTVTGDSRGNEDQVIPIILPAARGEQTESRYEVLARVEVPKADQYHVRVSAASDLSGTRGSIYTDVDVPDFRRAPVSLSGVVVSALPAVPVAPPRLLTDLTPVVPTARRSFAVAELATVFVRVYQGGNGRLQAVTMRAVIQDAQGAVAADESVRLAPDQFDDTRAAPFQFRLPLDRLAAGEHLLTVTATSGRDSARRDLVFERKVP